MISKEIWETVERDRYKNRMSYRDLRDVYGISMDALTRHFRRDVVNKLCALPGCGYRFKRKGRRNNSIYCSAKCRYKSAYLRRKAAKSGLDTSMASVLGSDGVDDRGIPDTESIQI